MNPHSLLQESIIAETFLDVRRRLFRQLLESMVYEKIVHPEIDEDGMARLHGEATYTFRVRQAFAFDRIRIDGIVMRNGSEAESPAQMLAELQPLHRAPDDLLARFAGELDETLLKDAMSAHWRRDKGALRGLAYDEIESRLPDGHPYHPGYKSRVGFDLVDNAAFSPEFAPRVRVIWLAAHHAGSARTHVSEINADAWLDDDLGDMCATFDAEMRRLGCDPRDYVRLAVHPWQWREIVAPRFAEEIRARRLIVLGESAEAYRPQQSIRTLANGDRLDGATLKLALSITNTSTSRLLARHTVLNGPRISEWLWQIAAEDPFLRDEMRVVVLREMMGASYDRAQPAALGPRTYGTLSCMWRESLHRWLEPEEDALPWNALCHVDLDGRPLIDPWVSDVEAWTSRLLSISVPAVMRFLCAHGIGLESHAQNMILIHRNGVPTRVALKDFHDGVRFSPAHLAAPARMPTLHPTPPTHVNVNRNSFITCDSPRKVADFVLDAFFFINIAELGFFLERHYGLSERRFWAMVEAQARAHGADASPFDLYAPTISVERLTNRRMFPETEVHEHAVSNPLHRIRTEAEALA